MKAAKIALIVLAPIVLIIGLWLGLRGNSGPALQKVEWVDVLSGRRVSLPKSVEKSIPCENSDGVRCVYPFYERDGETRIPNRYKGSIEDLFGSDPNLKVDLTTMRVDMSG